MLHLLFTVILSLALIQTTIAATGAQWRDRTIYQVLTDRFAQTDGSTTAPCDTADRIYCGGTFKGIQNKLDYIQGMGFDAIWISPVTAQLRGNTTYGYAYHGYWQRDLYEINPRFGTAQDLKDLSDALHKRSMYLMVDIVVNHNGARGPPKDIDFSIYNPFDKKSYYHPYCLIDFDDLENATNIEKCWFGDQYVPLPDLRTETQAVASGYQTWIKELVSNYSIDGLRLDTVFEVNKGFWSGFRKAAGIYMIGEVDLTNASWVCSYQELLPGVLNYGTYFPLIAAFSSTSGSISDLADAVNAVKSACKDTSLIGTFSENHDNPRFAFITPDMALAKNIVTFTMLTDGIPIIYEGQEQHYASVGSTDGNDPYNREAVWLSGYNTQAPLYKLIAKLNAARKQAIKDDSGYLAYQNFPIYTDTTTIAMRKGKMVTVLSNKGANGASYTQSIPAGFAAGKKVTELLTCATLTADSDGNIEVPMAKGLPRVYYPTSGLARSGICSASSEALTMRSVAHSHRKHKMKQWWW